MLMLQFLPVAIRSIMPTSTRDAITIFCLIFKSICSKEIKVKVLDKLQEELCVTLCLLEKYFPPSFFLMDVKLCGPVCFRWIYPFERCMKQIPKNMNTVGIPPEKHNNFGNQNDDYGISLRDGTPVSACRSVQVSPDLFIKAHFYVMQNTTEVVPYINRHKAFLKNQHPFKRNAWLENEHGKMFGQWLRKEVEKELSVSKESVSETVRWISHGPNTNVLKYDVYDINGYTFRTKCREGKVHQNSGVSVVATDTHISKGVVTYDQNSYFGVLKEIWVLDYHFKKIIVFMCDWVDNKNGVKKDPIGYTLVELGRLGHKDDPFLLSSQARQVFYVIDQLNKKCRLDTYDDVDEEFSSVLFPHIDNTLPRVDPLDLRKESRNDYFRTDCSGIVIHKAHENP
uniref:DUF4216 domain-containing protein n=1 Tax=Lactuca sativa TaxID=4236 RepID=A0A9R1UUP3_LACSA|nr:hypothetical protein LSAT_V11C800415350 [Lactuca sativa]